MMFKGLESRPTEYFAATHRTRQITECQNKVVLSEVLSEPLSSQLLSYFIFTQAKNKYDYKKIKNLINMYLC